MSYVFFTFFFLQEKSEKDKSKKTGNKKCHRFSKPFSAFIYAIAFINVTKCKLIKRNKQNWLIILFDMHVFKWVVLGKVVWLTVRACETFMPKYRENGERQCPGFSSDTSALFRIKDPLHFEDLWTKKRRFVGLTWRLILVLCKLVNFEVVDLDKANIKDACPFSLA